MKKKVIVEIEIPEGATHYLGSIVDEPTFVKCKQIGGFDHWFCCDNEVDWVLYSHAKPSFAKEIPFLEA